MLDEEKSENWVDVMHCIVNDNNIINGGEE